MKIKNQRRWFVKEPTTHQYLGRYVYEDNMMGDYGWFVPFTRDPLSLSEQEIKAINPRYWDWREEDKSCYRRKLGEQ